jgi:hypothetical protein
MKVRNVLSLIPVLCLFLTTLHAQTKLSVTLVGNSAVRIVIDDRNYICQDNSLTIDDLTPGYHSVKLFLVKKEKWNNPGYGQMVYNANLILKSQFYTDVVVNRFGKALVDEQPLSRGDFYDNGGKDWDNNNNNNHPVVTNPRPPQQPQQMQDNAFVAAREAIRKESFDNNKMALAQQIADNNYFSTAQVKELVKLFSFDERKLDFAKYAYGRTVDKNNYFMINEVFSFSKSKEELADYIRNFR